MSSNPATAAGDTFRKCNVAIEAAMRAGIKVPCFELAANKNIVLRADSSSASTSAVTCFAIPELFDEIVSQLEPYDKTRLYAVCGYFFAKLQSSLPVQKALLQRADPKPTLLWEIDAAAETISLALPSPFVNNKLITPSRFNPLILRHSSPEDAWFDIPH